MSENALAPSVPEGIEATTFAPVISHKDTQAQIWALGDRAEELTHKDPRLSDQLIIDAIRLSGGSHVLLDDSPAQCWFKEAEKAWQRVRELESALSQMRILAFLAGGFCLFVGVAFLVHRPC